MKRISALALMTGMVAPTLAGGCKDDGSDAITGSGMVTSASYAVDYTSEPESPVVGTNQLMLHVTNAEGEPVAGATVTVEAFMPAHGHGMASPPDVMETEPGSYHVTGLIFSMPGEWEITIGITVGDDTESVVVVLDVE
jgi:hypothetical protein